MEWKLKNKKYTKFLGIFIDDCLTWKEYANKVINRVHVNRKLLCNGKKLLNTNCLRNVYHAHIYSHLTYGLVVWGSMLNCKDTESIYKAQKQCIQTITNSAQRTHTDPLFQKLHTLHFPDMIKVKLAKLGFRLTNELLPSPLLNLFNKAGGKKQHRYPTRSKKTPNIQRHDKTLFNKSYLCQSLVEFMKIPGIARNAKTVRRFVANIKKQ